MAASTIQISTSENHVTVIETRVQGRSACRFAMSLYRNIIWFLKGIHEYTRNGFEAASAHFVDSDLDVSVAGRSFMITGANGGIGKAAAIAIAKRGGTVHMVCRNWERAEEAKDDICRETGNKDVYIHLLDMSEARKVWEFAESFKKRYRSLNVLINNAGCMVSQREVTKEGFEKNFATNTLGVYILTKSLLPVLERSGNPRVITVSSGDMLVQKLRTMDLQSEKGDFDAGMVYTQNKRQQVVMTERWAKAHGGVHFSSVHPGWVDSPDRRAVPTHLPLAWTRSSPEEEQNFMTQLDKLAKSFRTPAVTRFSLVKPLSDQFIVKPTF